MRWVTARVRSISIFKVDCGIPAATVRQACKQTPRCLDSRSVTGAVLTLPELPDQVARVRDIRKIPVATHPLPFPYNVDTLIRCASPLSLPHARPQRCTAFPGIPSSSWHLRIRDCLSVYRFLLWNFTPCSQISKEGIPNSASLAWAPQSSSTK